MSINEKQIYLLESLPGIGPTIALSLLDKFNTIKNFINADEKELQKVDKVGKIKARELKQLFEEEFRK